MRILICFDSEIVLQLTGMALEAAGHEVVVEREPARLAGEIAGAVALLVDASRAEQAAALGGKVIGHLEIESGRLVVAWGPENFEGLSKRSRDAVTGGTAAMQTLDGATGGLGQVVQVKPGRYRVDCGTLGDAGFWCGLRRESAPGSGARPTKTVRWSPPEGR